MGDRSMEDPPYVELRAHSAFSFGDGTATPEALVGAAAALGYAALGLTDAADFGGVVRFALAAWEAGITPIIGAELLVDGAPVALLARTSEGCRNLAALITRARAGCLDGRFAAVEGRKERGERRQAARPPRGRPHVTWQDVVDHSAGLFALTGPASGALATHIRRGTRDAALQQIATWRAVFGEACAVELQLHHAGRTEAALVGALIECGGASADPLGRDQRAAIRG